MNNRKLLMIPGPIEFDTQVNKTMGIPTVSHVAPSFIETFGSSLEMMRKVWGSSSGQPFILAGTGTLAMDSAVCNLVEDGDKVLVLSTGYFGERYAELLSRYGAEVDIIRAEPGKTVQEEEVEKYLRTGKYKLMTITHVDTSTAVRVDAKVMAELARRYNTLSVLDGVCSVAGEEIRQDKWDLDVVLTASQKAIGVPPGLALFVVSERAMEVWKNRKSKVRNFYADWGNWLPIMEAYEQRKASYFGTPAVNLVNALEISLQQILKEGITKRFTRHKRAGAAFRAAFKALSLRNMPLSNGIAANTLSAPFYPDKIDGAKLLKSINESGVVLAGGLHPDLKTRYFRVGHMGSVSKSDHIVKTIKAIESGLASCSYIFREGAGVEAAISSLNKGGI